MLDLKYKDLYSKIIEHYKNSHINPWHEISEIELNKYVEKFLNNNKVDNEYMFFYFVQSIIKKLSGTEDAHTMYECKKILPINFRIFDDGVLINYPENIKGSTLIAINDIEIKIILEEIENIIIYGTNGKRKYEIEKMLFNEIGLFSLPSLRKYDVLDFKIKALNDEYQNIVFEKNKKYNNTFDYIKYYYGDIASYYFKNNCLIYNHSSLQNKFEEKIKETIASLEKEDLKSIDKIIIDLRGNTGGNADNNKYLINFLKNSNKKLICMTDYRIFSGGRYALIEMIRLGAVTVGGEISAPINCYGNCNWKNFDEHYFSSSTSYLNPLNNINLNSKEEFEKEKIKELLKPIIFTPDIKIEQTKEDYISNIDTVLEYALAYSKDNIKIIN